MTKLPTLPQTPPTPSGMTASTINKELDRLDKVNLKICDAMIQAGRGSEKYLETLEKRRDYNPDNLTILFCEVHYRRGQLQNEIKRRMGPDAPSRFPSNELRFFKPLHKVE